MNEMGGACSTYGERRGAYSVSVKTPVGKKPLETPWCRWEDNIKIHLKEVGWGHVLD
jgi:hypothetical protein